ncbi:FadR/GntR family transcriptional regulator [Nocardioides marmoribigeumensis]|uniref:DNA-binding FadR family transcriptional regulator n=1 Tax=Nocardioides marmoribigeumensis TaxID=433649 RepID=A0ABU2BWG3_9ACTN|nr:FadR/GntR family transcriptional regulator [Nocardioides marmoribigeumensis]MDR7362414.1 DNA-binding FadR family transcriptional regulator [Nocardioides marmoribigeumensis]
MTTGNDAGPIFTTVKRVSPTHQVREQLLAAIQRGDYGPGAAIPSERVLCETFGVSRVSVREAIAGLESMGLIRVEHGRGAFVRESVNQSFMRPFGRYLEEHRGELLELIKVRGALDELAVAEATEHADAVGLDRLQAANDAFGEAVDAGRDDVDVARCDVTFHLTIAELAGGVLLPPLVRELNGVLGESRLLMLARPGQRERSVAEHQAIIDALVARDVVAARRAVRKHLEPIRDWLLESAQETAQESAQESAQGSEETPD